MTSLRAVLPAIVLAGMVAGCGARNSAEYTIGEQRVSVNIPAGWEAFDEGKQIRIHKAPADVVLRDLGAAGPKGYRHEVEQARELWRKGRGDEARARMHRMELPHDQLEARTDGNSFRDAWYGVVEAPKEAAFAELSPWFETIVAGIDALPPPDLRAVADASLAKLGHDARRDVKSRITATIDGRDALDVETWNRLSHATPQRLLFVLNDGYLLAFYTGQGADTDAMTAFETMRAGLHFPGVEPRR
jgi:hypothetical protein